MATDSPSRLAAGAEISGLNTSLTRSQKTCSIVVVRASAIAKVTRSRQLAALGRKRTFHL